MADPIVAGSTKVNWEVEIAGEKIQQGDIWALTVESGLNLADSCELILTRSGTEKHTERIANAKRATMKVKMAQAGDPLDYVFIGEVTGHAPASNQTGGADGTTRVSAYNAISGLLLDDVTGTYGTKEGETIEAIFKRILDKRHGALGLKLEFGKDKPTVKHRHVFQHTENDFHFMARLAAEEGYNILVRDTAFIVSKWTKEASPIKLRTQNAPRMVGDDKGVINLWSFAPTRDDSGQVVEVRLRYWQSHRRQELEVTVKSEGDARTGATSTSEKYKQTKRYFNDIPFRDVEEGKAKAEALLDRLRRMYVTATATCSGDPRIKPGMLLKVADVDPDFGGAYHVTNVKHAYDHEGGRPFTTEFSLCRATLEERKSS